MISRKPPFNPSTSSTSSGQASSGLWRDKIELGDETEQGGQKRNQDCIPQKAQPFADPPIPIGDIMLKSWGINFGQGLLEVVKKAGQSFYKLSNVNLSDISRAPQCEDEYSDKDYSTNVFGAL